MSSARTILVTGANGFVGQALCAALAAAGKSVRRAVRRADTGQGPEQPASGSVATTVVGDVGPDTDWTAALRDVAGVVHLAARAHVLHETEPDAEAAFARINAAGTGHLARAAAIAGVSRFVYVSTIGVNGTGAMANGVLSETDPPRPNGAYARSKWQGELALEAVARETGMEHVIVRPPLVYGPGNPGNLLRLLAAIDRGWPLPVASIGNRRSFIYCANLVSALQACLDHPAAAGSLFLVSDRETMSTPALIRELASALGKPARLLPCPAAVLRIAGALAGRGSDVARLLDSLVVDASRIERELGWRPPHPAAAGLKATAEWYGTRLGRGIPGRPKPSDTVEAPSRPRP